MKTVIFDIHAFEQPLFVEMNKSVGHDLTFLPVKLTSQTAHLAKGFFAVVSFANDKVDAATIDVLKDIGVRLICLRCAGYNHVDVAHAKKVSMPVVRVPKYSPYAVAEYAVALLLSLNRKTHRAYARVKESNFSIDGLMGFDLHGKTVGVIGTGKIGAVFAKIMNGFGARVLAYDIAPTPLPNVEYVTLQKLYESSDVISMHTPLTQATRHMINESTLASMKKGVYLINTGRGGLIETKALIKSLKSGHIGAAGLDVYEEEEGVFFQDHSQDILQDDHLVRLMTFPNVLITAHQAFLTKEALHNIVETTLANLTQFEKGLPLENEVQ